MSIIVGDPSTYPTSFEAPDDGDDEDAESVNVAIEALANRTEYLKALKHPASGIIRWCRGGETSLSPAGDKFWSRGSISGSYGAWVLNHPDADGNDSVLTMPVRLPHGAVLAEVRAYLDGTPTSGTHSAMPSSKPSMRLVKVDPVTGTCTSLGNATDAETTVVGYEALHNWALGFFTPPTIDNASFHYAVQVHGEAGTNSKGGSKLYGVRLQFSMTNLDEAAS